MPIILKSQHWNIQLSPTHGAAILQCQYNGHDILRPYAETPDSDFEVLNSSGFCLVPFSNRIENGHFRHHAREGNLSPTHRAIQHPIHGFGWVSTWDVEKTGPNFVTLGQTYSGEEWPWAYRAEQTLRVDGPVLRHDLSIKNLSEHPMPAGLGFHPYFPDAKNANLTCHSRGVWHTRKDGIPNSHTTVPDRWDFSKGRNIAGTQIDNAFTQVDPIAVLQWSNTSHSVRLEGSLNLPFAVIYTSNPDGSFCYEPVSHMPDAINRQQSNDATGLIDLPPGDTFKVWMSYTVL